MSENKVMNWLLAALSKHQEQDIQADDNDSVVCGMPLDDEDTAALHCKGKANAMCIRINAYARDLLVGMVKVAQTERYRQGQHVLASCGFPPEQRTRAMVMCNQVNDTIVAGRFIVDPDNGELYMEMPIVLHGRVNDDERMLSEVFGKIEFFICRYVPLILKGAQGDTKAAMQDVRNARNLPHVIEGFTFTTVKLDEPFNEQDKLPFGKVVSMGEALGATESGPVDTETSDTGSETMHVETIDMSQENPDDKGPEGPSQEP